jgi:transcriptional regulator with XRE-family HTH domain
LLPVDDLRAAFGQRVKELRERLDWSQEKLSERANLDTTYISGIERGQRNPGLNTLQRLARALGVTLPALLSDLRQPRHREVRRGRPRKRASLRA